LVRPDVANEQWPTMTFKRPKFRAHVKAHRTIIGIDVRFHKSGDRDRKRLIGK
jgi:hypothetical protein